MSPFVFALIASSTASAPFFALGPDAGWAGGADDRYFAVARDAAGNIIAAGYSTDPNGDSHGLIVKHLPSGALDPSFGEGGAVVASFFTEADRHEDRLMDVSVDAEGRILVVGRAGFDGQSLAVIARYTTDGRPDLSFAERGFAVGLAGEPYLGASWFRSRPAELFHALAIDRNGRIIACGVSSDVRWSWRGGTRRYRSLLVRFDPSGHPDLHFGDEGFVLSRGDGQGFGARERDDCIDVVSLPDGGIAFAGWVDGPDPDGEGALLAQLTEAGALDARFNARGTPGYQLSGVPSRAGGKKEVYYELERDDEGRFVTSGFSFDANSAHTQALVARFLPDGRSDPSFGDRGARVEAPGALTGSAEELVMAHALDARGRIVIVGFTDDTQAHDGRVDRAFVARYVEDGTPDASFNADGVRPGYFSSWENGRSRFTPESHDTFEDVLIIGGTQIWAVGSSGGRTLLVSFVDQASLVDR